MKENDIKVKLNLVKNIEVEDNKGRIRSIEYYTNDENEIKDILRLAGMLKSDLEKEPPLLPKYCSDEKEHENKTCSCYDENIENEKEIKSVMVYDLNDFASDLRSTFDSTNFENWLDVFKNFRLKLINKGFSPEASERIIFDILCDYIEKKEINESHECEYEDSKDNLKINRRSYLTIDIDSYDPENNYLGSLGSLEISSEDDGDLKTILKLAGLTINNLVGEVEKKRNELDESKNTKDKTNKEVKKNEEKNIYVLEVDIEKDIGSDKKKKESKGHLRLFANNKEEIIEIIDLLNDYFEKVKRKGMSDSEFKKVHVDDKKKLEENEIIIDKNPFVLKDRRIITNASLDYLNTNFTSQRFVKYGDNPLLYDSEERMKKEYIEKKIMKKYKDFD